jgi:hypothetical protein
VSGKVVQFPTGSTDPTGSTGSAPIDGAVLLDDLRGWYGTYIRPFDSADLDLLSVWTAHTHVPNECYTSPRLQIDSSMYGSGKTTLCEHLGRLCGHGVLMGQVSSPAMMARLLFANAALPATLIIDEADRNLKPDRPGVDDLLSVLNSGYKLGATRPVTVPDGQGGWRVENMPTFAPVVISGNAPLLPDDTRSRCLRVLLVPDLDGLVDDTDWEMIESGAVHLKRRLSDWASSASDRIAGLAVDLPDDCRGRMKDKWRPLMRVAVVAGGHWPQTVTDLAVRDIREQRAEREDGQQSMPPAMRLMHHLHRLWNVPGGLFYGRTFVSTKDMLAALKTFHPEDWSAANARGHELSAQSLGRMIRQVVKVYTTRIEHGGPRGYLCADLLSSWRRLGLAPQPAHVVQTGSTDTTRPDEPDQPAEPVLEGTESAAEPDVSVQTSCVGSGSDRRQTVPDTERSSDASRIEGLFGMNGMCPDHPDIRLVGGRCGLCIANKHNRKASG